jgi:hypothetical protein
MTSSRFFSNASPPDCQTFTTVHGGPSFSVSQNLFAFWRRIYFEAHNTMGLRGFLSALFARLRSLYFVIRVLLAPSKVAHHLWRHVRDDNGANPVVRAWTRGVFGDEVCLLFGFSSGSFPGPPLLTFASLHARSLATNTTRSCSCGRRPTARRSTSHRSAIWRNGAASTLSLATRFWVLATATLAASEAQPEENCGMIYLVPPRRFEF